MNDECENMKDKTIKHKKVSSNQTSERMVRAIANGDNVNAYKLLEKRMREKVAEKIDNALKDE